MIIYAIYRATIINDYDVIVIIIFVMIVRHDCYSYLTLYSNIIKVQQSNIGQGRAAMQYSREEYNTKYQQHQHNHSDSRSHIHLQYGQQQEEQSCSRYSQYSQPQPQYEQHNYNHSYGHQYEYQYNYRHDRNQRNNNTHHVHRQQPIRHHHTQQRQQDQTQQQQQYDYDELHMEQFNNNSAGESVRQVYSSRAIRTMSSIGQKQRLINSQQIQARKLQYHSNSRYISNQCYNTIPLKESIKQNVHTNENKNNQNNSNSSNSNNNSHNNNKHKIVMKARYHRQAENTHPSNINNNNPNDHNNNNNKTDHVIKPTHISVQQQKQQHQQQQQQQLQQPLGINRVVSDLVVQNNEYLHRLNQSVVNRLLAIIENSQQMHINQHSSMGNSLGNSRWDTNTNNNTNNSGSNNNYINTNANTNTNTKMKSYTKDRTSHSKSRYNSIDFHNNSVTHDNDTMVSQSQPTYANNVPKQKQIQPQSQQQQQSIKSGHNTITINNIMPASAHKSNTNPYNNHHNHNNSTSQFGRQEAQLARLQNKRNRNRKREFIGYTTNSHQNSNSDYETPRMSAQVTNMSTPSYFTSNNNNNNNTPAVNSYNASAQQMRKRSSLSIQFDQVPEDPFETEKQHIEQPKMQKTHKIPELQTQAQGVSHSNSLIEQPFKYNNCTNETVSSTEQNQNREKSTLHDKNNNGNNFDTTCPPVIYQKPVFMEIPKDQTQIIGGQSNGLSLAEAFKRRIGKLPSKEERKAKEQQNAHNNGSKVEQQQHSQSEHKSTIKKALSCSVGRQKPNRKSRKQKQNANPSTGQLNIDPSNAISSPVLNAFATPKSQEPSEELLNRLIGGSKAKVSKKEMYALTRKNYENLPEVQERKKSEQRRQLELARLERIKEYQRSIRASKQTIA